MPSASRLIAKAGSMLPNGIGKKRDQREEAADHADESHGRRRHHGLQTLSEQRVARDQPGRDATHRRSDRRLRQRAVTDRARDPGRRAQRELHRHEQQRGTEDRRCARWHRQHVRRTAASAPPAHAGRTRAAARRPTRDRIRDRRPASAASARSGGCPSRRRQSMRSAGRSTRVHLPAGRGILWREPVCSSAHRRRCHAPARVARQPGTPQRPPGA